MGGDFFIVLGFLLEFSNEFIKLNYDEKVKYGVSYSDIDFFSYFLEQVDRQLNYEEGLEKFSQKVKYEQFF